MPNYAAPSFTEALFPGFEEYVLQNDPDVAFGRFLERFLGNRNLTDYLLRNRNRLYLGYLSQAARNPNTSFLSFLEGARPEQEFRSLTPQERGESPRSFVSRVKYLGF